MSQGNFSERNIQEPSTMSSQGSRHLLVGLVLLCFLVPSFVAIVAFAYHWWTGQVFERREVKSLAFLAWGSTLAAQCCFALCRRREPGRTYDRGYVSVPRVSSNNQQAMKWEQRNAKRILVNFYAVAIVIPLVALFLAGIVLWWTGYLLKRGDVPIFLLSAWGGSLAVNALLAIRSRQERIFFEGASPSSDRRVTVHVDEAGSASSGDLSEEMSEADEDSSQ